MTSTTSTTQGTTTATVVPGAPDGIIRVFTAGREDSSEVRKAARSAAQKAHGFGSIGATPVPVPAKFRNVTGLGWDFAPVAKSRTAPKAPVVTFTEPTELSKAERKAAKAARKAAKAKAAAAPAKAEPKAAVPFLGAKAKAEAATCKTCCDFGVVRRAGARAGGAYKTQNGADTAKANGNAVPCPSHVTVKRGKRSA